MTYHYNETHKHPEQKEDEVWLTNADEETFRTKIGYSSKRLGTVAYGSDGNLLKFDGFWPVFVKKSEHEENMRKYEEEDKT